jgi:rubredoxin
MTWNLDAVNWWIVAPIIGGVLFIAFVRPWRFFADRRHCPQCKKLLARWGRWGWKDDWTCPRCGCLIHR